MKTITIKPGAWDKGAEHRKGALDLRKAVRDILTVLNVPFEDPCCPDSNADVGQPVRTVNGTVQTFNGDEWVASETQTPQTLTGAGAVNLTTRSTLLVTTGANALTLAAGSEGQRKFIRMKTDGGDGTLTVTNGQGFTTITFNDAGDFVELFYIDGKWHIISNSGATVA